MGAWSQRLILVAVGVAIGAVGYSILQHYSAEATRMTPAPPVTEAPRPEQQASGPAVSTEKKDDRESMREANRERASGNYVLDSHIPWVRERLAERDRKVIEAIMIERGPIYEKMFAGYGMNPQQISQALHHIALIYQSKLDARKAMTAQVNAQMEFDIRMQQIMGSHHKEYLAYEAGGRAREESLLIGQFAQSSGLSPISGERVEALHSLLLEATAYTQKTRGSLSGPRDEVARPNYGEAAVAELEEKQAVLSLGSASVIERARQQGFSADEIATLEKYFEKEIGAYEKQIRQASNSAEGQIAVLERQLAKLKLQNASAWATAPYEQALDNLRSKSTAGR